MAHNTRNCQASDCNREADLAISNTAPRGKGLKTTIWQFDEEAPSTAVRYCILHGVQTAAQLAQLSAAGETRVTVELVRP